VLSEAELDQLLANKLAIRDGLKLLSQHPAAQKLSNLYKDEKNDSIKILVSLKIGLPSRWIADGKSPDGVLATEPVTFVFPADYPIHAPTVILRDDFDRSHAHIQPGAPDSPIIPCIYDGDLNELLQYRGLWEIVNQAISWLEKAATRTLIDPEQGWEPVRRDNLDHCIIADSSFLYSLVSQSEKHHIFSFLYLKSHLQKNNRSSTKYLIYGNIEKERLNISPLDPKSLKQNLFEDRCSDNAVIGISIAIIVTPGKLPSGKFLISDQYSPETVTNLAELKQKAQAYGCKNALDTIICHLRKCAQTLSSHRSTFPVTIILCARRPHNLIGSDSNIELLPYITEIQLPKLFPKGDETPVYPAGHRESISPELLKRLSGETLSSAERDVVLVGCGSLGSKIALHLARSGTAPSAVIDKGFLSPHNAARHALIPGPQIFQAGWLSSKAQALTEAIQGLGQSTKSYREDVTYAATDEALTKKLFPKKIWGIINATASLTVREAIASIPVSQLNSRTIETSLFGGGAVGIMSVEGNNRNPNSLDLIAEAYEFMRQDEFLSQTVFEDSDIIQFQEIGQGCGSATMIMSDARISLFAASMAQGIAQLRVNDFPTLNGRLLMGRLTEDEMGLSWEAVNIPPVYLVEIDNSPWTVRISARANHKICQEYKFYPNIETGGILVGRVSEVSKTFLVTDVLPAPSDSKRLPNQFVLGTHDVSKMLQAYEASCKSALYCLGTWHTHLNASGPSQTDIRTAKLICESRIMPSILVIKNKSGYRAILSKE
jgi:integrative and conjugative element protein (TIGR02256 family)